MKINPSSILVGTSGLAWGAAALAAVMEAISIKVFGLAVGVALAITLWAVAREATTVVAAAIQDHASRMEAVTSAHGRHLRQHVFAADRWWMNARRAETLSKFDAALSVGDGDDPPGSDTGPFRIINGGIG